MKTIRPDALERFCISALQRAGLKEDDAAISANVLVTTDLFGVFSHGTAQLGNYVRKILAGGIDAHAQAVVVQEGPAWAVLDGNAAMGMVTAVRAMETAIRKASGTGIAYVGVRNSNHYGAAGYYALLAASRGMIGVAMSNADPCMTAPGGRTSLLGTNPLAYAAPSGEEWPVFFDVALSATAATKIHTAKATGAAIPEGWLVDGDGLPTTDVSNWPQSGSQLPMAGHKGFGLAILVEVLSAVLSGSAVAGEVKGWIAQLSEPPGTGHAFLAIDLSKMMPLEEFGDRMDRMSRTIRGAPKARGSARIFLPGEMEWEKRDIASREGIALPAIVLDSLVQISGELGMEFESVLEDRP